MDAPLSGIRDSFDRYVERFRSADPDVQRNIDLKYRHSRHVMAEAAALARSLGLDAEQTRWARVMGLLHDVGRFEQYRRYHTFVDTASEDHAALGVRVLQTETMLNGHPRVWIDRVLKAIAYHNRYRLPVHEAPEDLFYARLLRDADKLDIFRVVIEYYHRSSGRRNPAIELDLPDGPEPTPEVLRDLHEGRSVDKHFVRTLTDFKLLQVGWVYDINFAFTYRQILQRGILDRMAAALPRGRAIRETLAAIEDFVSARARGPAPDRNGGQWPHRTTSPEGSPWPG